MILSQEQQMVRDMARDFSREKLAPFAAEWDRDHRFPAEAISEMASLGFMGITELFGGQSSGIFTATLISMMSIAVGVQTGLLLWRAAIQMSGSPHRRALHD